VDSGSVPFLIVFVSYVLRVRPEGLQDGRFSGEVEAVATGQRFAVRSLDELLAFVVETMTEGWLGGSWAGGS
jgi:hypothetical protein